MGRWKSGHGKLLRGADLSCMTVQLASPVPHICPAAICHLFFCLEATHQGHIALSRTQNGGLKISPANLYWMLGALDLMI